MTLFDILLEYHPIWFMVACEQARVMSTWRETRALSPGSLRSLLKEKSLLAGLLYKKTSLLALSVVERSE